VKTEKKRAINLYLLFSPDDAGHEEQIERILGRLTFEYHGSTNLMLPAAFQCVRRSRSLPSAPRVV